MLDRNERLKLNIYFQLKMPRFFKIYIFLIIVVGLWSCSKPVKTIYENNQTDTATVLSEKKIYRLKKNTINSNFNYFQLNNIDSYLGDWHNLGQIFEPVDGRHNFYKFMATFKGESYAGTIKDFHDILIIKTDSENKILDAYQYTTEWAEPPCQYDVYRGSVNDLVLTDNFDISALKLIRTDYWDEKDKLHTEDGTIKLK